jgi:1-phosphofructokinase family hexose kinase
MPPLVLALNPSVDVEWRVAKIRREEKNEVLSERRWPGGKGVNVARWLKHLGARPRLLIPLGGPTGKEIATGLASEAIDTRVHPLRAATRANVIVTADSGGQLRFNPLGPALSPADWQALLRLIKRELPRASLLVLSGSLPRGVRPDAYAEILCLAREAGVKTLLDCDGPPFAAAVTVQPFLVKPNHHELAEWYNRPVRSAEGLRKAAHQLSQVTRGWVLVSRGAAGAILVHSQNGFDLHLAAPAVKPLNTVGAGDALVAAVAREIERKSAPQEWLRRGVAAGTAATTQLAGHLPNRACLSRMAARIRRR